MGNTQYLLSSGLLLGAGLIQAETVNGDEPVGNLTDMLTDECRQEAPLRVISFISVTMGITALNGGYGGGGDGGGKGGGGDGGGGGGSGG